MLSFSTDAAGVVHFTTTQASKVSSLGAVWRETFAKKPPFKPRGQYASHGEEERYNKLPEFERFSCGNNAFVIDGLDEPLIVGKQELSYFVPDGYSKREFKPACVTSLPSMSANHAEVNAPDHLQRIWLLVNKAFENFDLYVTVRGTVSTNTTSPPSEATVRAALARAAAGEAIIIPAVTAARTLYVTDIVLSRSRDTAVAAFGMMVL